MNRKSWNELHSKLNACLGFTLGILALVQIDLLYSTSAALRNTAPKDSQRQADTLIVTQAGRRVSNSTDQPPPSPEQMVDQITKDQAIKLRRDFQKKLLSEIRDLKEVQKRELKTSGDERKNRKKEWDNTEKSHDENFFDENLHGPERRTYMHNLIERRKAFNQSIKDEEKAQREIQNARRMELEADQRKRRQEFDASLSRNLKPPSSVWGSN